METDTSTHALLSSADMLLTGPTSEIFSSVDASSWSIDYELSANLDASVEMELSLSPDVGFSTQSSEMVSLFSCLFNLILAMFTLFIIHLNIPIF